MQSEKAIAYTAFVAGVLIILITLYMGYGLYGTIIAAASSPHNTTTPASNGSLNQSISSAISSAIGAHLPSSGVFFLLLDIILLFLFANIGYKIAILGVHMNASAKAKQESVSRDKNGKKP
ncbi:hypothetical protein M1567_01650 [Candidatus Marsarchaeota archaeon]|nr:hypothetical protein [Candidatus Marsarchaeota archaeon]